MMKRKELQMLPLTFNGDKAEITNLISRKYTKVVAIKRKVYLVNSEGYSMRVKCELLVPTKTIVKHLQKVIKYVTDESIILSSVHVDTSCVNAMKEMDRRNIRALASFGVRPLTDRDEAVRVLRDINKYIVPDSSHSMFKTDEIVWGNFETPALIGLATGMVGVINPLRPLAKLMVKCIDKKIASLKETK